MKPSHFNHLKLCKNFNITLKKYILIKPLKRITTVYPLKTSMMWPLQNFLLYNGPIMQMIKKEKK